MEVDAERLRSDIKRNANFGQVDVEEGLGRTVFTGTPANEDARDYFVQRLEDAGLSVRIDAVGNIAGRWVPEQADPNAAPVAAGSHLDSVPEGGIFDGPLGVYAALEAVRALKESDTVLTRPVDVVSFTEEEGQRFTSLTGSLFATGQRSAAELHELTDDNETLESALERIGYLGSDTIDASEWDAWLELHVEQDTRLETAGLPVGVVTDITGIAQQTVKLTGEADHAGTTLMGDRQDALAAAAAVITDIERSATEIAAENETAVATVGKADVRPNGTNVVPGHVRLGVDVRDIDRMSMDQMLATLDESLESVETERNVSTSTETICNIDPTHLSERCCQAIQTAAAKRDIETMTLHSGAGHDTMSITEVTDTAMLFAPSRDGISHNPREWTEWTDCTTATRVLAGALADLAS